MKNYFLLAAVVLLTACAGEEPMETQSINDELSLSRIESFYTSENDLGVKKRVQYLEDGAIVADTIFDGSSLEILGKVEHVNNGNVYSETHYSSIGDDAQVTASITSAYDNEGRLIEKQSVGEFGNYIITFTYGNGIINAVQTYTEGGLEPETAQYTVNAEGIIESATYNLGDGVQYTSTLEFENGKPVKCNVNSDVESVVYTFSYYSNPVPASHLKSATQINNKLIENGFFNTGRFALTGISHFGNYYLQNSENTIGHYEESVKDFNTAGYIISDHMLMTGGLMSDTYYIYE